LNPFHKELICLKEASFSATAASVGLWALLKVRSKQIHKELICPKGASFSATAASVAFWALLKVHLNCVLARTLMNDFKKLERELRHYM
jgi:hypothetical protein